jgi:anti-sigma factor RsiW
MVLKDHEGQPTGSAAHQETWERLPWYVNGTLRNDEVLLVEGHLSNCVTCRSELNELRQIGRLVHGSEDYLPSPSRGLKNILTRIDAAQPATRVSRSRFQALVKRTPWMLRVTVAGQAALILLLLGVLIGVPRGGPEPGYRTLSEPETVSVTPAVVLRVVFDEDAREIEIRELLHQLGGQIVKGPSPRGVYTLEAETSDPAFALNELRSKPIVSFAEWIREDGGESPR